MGGSNDPGSEPTEREWQLAERWCGCEPCTADLACHSWLARRLAAYRREVTADLDSVERHLGEIIREQLALNPYRADAPNGVWPVHADLAGPDAPTLSVQPLHSELRPAVLAFAQQMEQRLREHDAERGERGWTNETPGWLMDRLHMEARELRYASSHGGDVAGEAADVGNFAMMVADVKGALDATHLHRLAGGQDSGESARVADRLTDERLREYATHIADCDPDLQFMARELLDARHRLAGAPQGQEHTCIAAIAAEPGGKPYRVDLSDGSAVQARLTTTSGAHLQVISRKHAQPQEQPSESVPEPTQGPGRDEVERCPYCGDGRESRSGGRIHRVSRDHLTRCWTQRWWEVYVAMMGSSTQVPPRHWVDERVNAAAVHLRGEGGDDG